MRTVAPRIAHLNHGHDENPLNIPRSPFIFLDHFLFGPVNLHLSEVRVELAPTVGNSTS